MTAIELRAEIQQLLGQEENISVLEAIRILLRRGEPMEDDLTDENIAELDQRRARHLRGEGRSYTMEESLAKLRNPEK